MRESGRLSKREGRFTANKKNTEQKPIANIFAL